MSTPVVNGTTPETFLLPPNCDQQQWCLDWYGYVNYLPSVAGNAFFLAAFSVGLITQLFLGIRYRAWTFTGPMLVGIILEIVGYGGRIGMHQDVFSDSWFIMYLCCLTIAPALFSAALYLSLSRIIAIYSNNHAKLSLLAPRTITLSFITFDFLSLLLQAIGGALASTASTPETRDTGVNIMVAGLSTQVAATTLFAVLCLHLMYTIRKRPERVDNASTDKVTLRQSKRFKGFLIAVGVAVITILIRCAFRVAELSEGFKGELANNETLFMIFDSTMMVICVAVLSAAHPGWVMGGWWKMGQVSFRGRKRATLGGADGVASEGGLEQHANKDEKRGAAGAGVSSGSTSDSVS
ncbi:Sphingoid long-chain base transporter RSB1 [Cyphellophora attinorum]|uniref:Sphingoid long-chain base transporter RSB1 n=1 Tax=Cyphellophora attinorum TaxID=1664694 RepID=A0A0N1H0T4_9EURO|nr:Sphingoid long-chain base transporter RSB1 [Phialophora attinorum]KPI37650.1 Sphingoid long-chain base transporter RSB1 [Phialophora attinorum]